MIIKYIIYTMYKHFLILKFSSLLLFIHYLNQLKLIFVTFFRSLFTFLPFFLHSFVRMALFLSFIPIDLFYFQFSILSVKCLTAPLSYCTVITAFR